MKEINGYALRDAMMDAINDCERQYMLIDQERVEGIGLPSLTNDDPYPVDPRIARKEFVRAKIAGLRIALSITYAMIGDEAMAAQMRQDTAVA